jgi:hypothetical protein
LEEIVLSQSSLPADFKPPCNFKTLKASVFKEALVWNQYRINLKSNRLISACSLKNHSAFSVEKSEHFLLRLLSLPLKPLSLDKRKKIGPPPLGGEKDQRKFWLPPKFVEGQKSAEADFEVFETLWPKDGSDLSNRKIELYFDKFFAWPYFIQINTPQLTVFLKTIDSGRNFPHFSRLN